MKHSDNLRGRVRRGFGPSLRLACAALVFPLAACDIDGVLDVEDPDVTLPATLQDPSNLAALRGSVIADFQVGYGGAGQTEGLTIATGLFTDEFYHAGTFQQNRELDLRTVPESNSATTNAFRGMQRARRSAEFAVGAFEATEQRNTPGHAEMASLAGYTYLLIAEAYCSGVPFSTQEADGSLVPGMPLSTAEMFDKAASYFDQGLTIATAARNAARTRADTVAAENQQHLARIGRGRTLLNQNRYADAAAAVAGVPRDYVYLVEHSDNTTRQNNGINGLTIVRREYGIASGQGGNGLAFRQGTTSAGQDPRTTWSISAAGGADPRIYHWTQQRFPTRATANVLASGVEATLIRAEAVLNRGASAQYVDSLNSLRSSATAIMGRFGANVAAAAGPLVALTDPGTPATRVNQFFAERAFWTYGMSQRLPAMRRLVRQYGRAANTVFPTGQYTRPGRNTGTGAFTGEVAFGTYGTDVNFPLPLDEQNNPNFTQCQNRDA
jgi:hypothetical protein